MKIQLNSDNQVVVNAALTGAVKSTVRRVLGKFENQLTRIEVHLSDLNSHKSGFRDKRCQLEARPAGKRPVSVSDKSATIRQSVLGAATKMKRLLETSFGKASYQSFARPSNGANKKQGRTPNTKKVVGKRERSKGVSPGGMTIAKPARSLSKRPARRRATARVSTTSVKNASAKEVLTKTVSRTQRRLKKKRIYQARRKRWPRR